MAALLRVPHGFILRHLSKVERGLTAAGLAGLMYLLISSHPFYPPFWDGVIVAAVFLVSLTSPFFGFSVAVLSVSYPVSAISIYLGVLVFAIAVLAHRPLTQHLGATVLVLSAPLLGGYSLGWVIPLLGGLWWGAAGGSWIGALAALWGMVVAGIAGLNPDWLGMAGQFPSMPVVLERFADKNSLETLSLVFSPMMPDTTVLLYHLMQMAVWGMVGTIVGSLNDRPNVQNRRPWGGAILALVGGFVLLGSHVLLGIWLKQPAAETANYRFLIMSAATAGVIAAALEMLQDFFEHPLPRLGRAKPRPGRATASEPVSGPEPVPPPASYPPFHEKKEKGSEDLIMLELDE